MKSRRSDRRKFLKDSAVLAGLAAGAIRSASALPLAADAPMVSPSKDYPEYGERSRFETTARKPDYPKSTFPSKKITPLQDSIGIITPSPFHFVANHSVPPDIDPRQYRLTVHGMVERPLDFTLDD